MAWSIKVLTTALLFCAGLCKWKSKYLLAYVALLAIYTHFDLSVFVPTVVGIQEGYAILAHNFCRHLYSKLNDGIC